MYCMLTCLQMNVTTLYAVGLDVSYSEEDHYLFFLIAAVPYDCRGIIVSSLMGDYLLFGDRITERRSCNVWSQTEKKIIKRKPSGKICKEKSWTGNGSRLAKMEPVLRRSTTPNAIIRRIINGEDLTKREMEGNGWFGSWKSHPFICFPKCRSQYESRQRNYGKIIRKSSIVLPSVLGLNCWIYEGEKYWSESSW